MKLKTTKICELKCHPQNPNTHPESQVVELQKSLDQFEQVKNIVVWQGQVIAGNGLLSAARASGLKEIQVQDVSDWSEDKAKSFMVADNRLADIAIMDDDSLAGLLKEFDNPLDLPGVDEVFLESLMIDGQELDNPEKEWEGMPEFDQKDLSPFRTLKVHFENQADIDDFAELIKQKITEKTKYVWIPKAKIDRSANKRYTNES